MARIVYKLNNFIFTFLSTIAISFVISIIILCSYVFINNNLINNIYFTDFNTNYFDEGGTGREIKFVQTNDSFSQKLEIMDFRAVVFDEYFRRNNSPLYGLGSVFVDRCEKYKAPKDCTIMVAIARAETDLCKYPPSQAQKNCWGFGGSGQNRYDFSSYAEGIDVVTERLANGYGYKCMIDPRAMEMVYCGQRPSCQGWGEVILKFMDGINKLSIEMGYQALYSLREN